MNPDKIVTENMIENFSNVYADEMHEYNVGITCVRIDEELNLEIRELWESKCQTHHFKKL